jgi:hypothetical protein
VNTTFIQRAVAQFRMYEQSHRAKGTPDGDAKAETNRLMAEEGEQALTTPDHHAFRRGVHSAVQAVVADLSALIERRTKAHAPQQMTETIRAMALRISSNPYPTEDPGPSESDPEVPADPRPTPEVQIAVASLAAEESGLPITLTASSDGILVMGTAQGRTALRRVAWSQLTQSDAPMLSLAVEVVIEELRG